MSSKKQHIINYLCIGRTIKNSSDAKFLGKPTLTQLILLKLVAFLLIPRYNSYVGGVLAGF
jgi:hypothetical protein